MASGKLGEAYIEIRAKPEQLEQDLDQSEAKVRESTGKMASQVETNVKGKWAEAGEAAKKSIEKVTSALGAMTAAFGVFTAALQVGQAIGAKVFGDWRKELENIRRELELVTSIQRSQTLDAIEGNTQALTSQLEVINASILEYHALVEAGFAFTASLKHDIELLEHQRDILRGLIELNSRKAQKIIEAAEAAKKEADEMERAAAASKQIAENITTARIEGERIMRFIQDEIAGKHKADKYGPFIPDDLPEKGKQAGKDAGEAFAQGFSQATQAMQNQVFNQNITGPLETYIQRIEAKLDEVAGRRR